MSTAGRLLSGAAAGFSGAALYNSREALAGGVYNAASWLAQPRTRSLDDAALHALSAQVSALTGLVAATARTRGASSLVSSSLLCCGGVACVGGALLSRFSLDELLYVSRAGFGRGLRTVTAALSALSAALARVKTALTERLDHVAEKVDDLAGGQKRIEAALEGAHGELSELATTIASIEATLSDVVAKQELGNKGIFALCNVVNSGGVSPQSARSMEEVQAAAAKNMRSPESVEAQLAIISRLACSV